MEQEDQPRADDSGLAAVGRAEPCGEGELHQDSQADARCWCWAQGLPREESPVDPGEGSGGEAADGEEDD